MIMAKKLFTKKGKRARRKVKASLKKYHRKGNPFAIVTERVKGARLKRTRRCR
jgi:hypothetical protein